MSNSTLAKQEEKSSNSSKSKTTNEKIKNTQTDELIIGICYPIGSESTSVINTLINRLEEYKYEVEIIKISSFIKEYYKKEKTLKAGQTEAYADLMYKIEGGDFLRNKYDNNSILADLAIKKIRLD